MENINREIRILNQELLLKKKKKNRISEFRFPKDNNSKILLVKKLPKTNLKQIQIKTNTLNRNQF